MNILFQKWGWKNDIDMKIDNLQLLYDIDKKYPTECKPEVLKLYTRDYLRNEPL